MTDVDSNEIEFQCPICGNDLKQTIGQLKAERHMTCPGCGIGININTDRLANAAAEIQNAKGGSAAITAARAVRTSSADGPIRHLGEAARREPPRRHVALCHDYQ